MSKVAEETTYRSPVKKLMRFFKMSRDAWKEKNRKSKKRLKSFDTRLRVMRKDRNRWKELAREQEAELGRLREELEAVKTSSWSRPGPRRCRKSSPGPCPGTNMPRE
jgi:hypothetical protein